MNLLAIDTTADICSIALFKSAERFGYHQSKPREHAKLTLPIVSDLLSQAELKVADLDFIVFGRGPGSFTGVRIATGVAQGLALSCDIGLLPISTLQSLAWTAAKTGAKRIYVAIDARMSEIYFAQYQVSADGIPELVDHEQVLAPNLLSLEKEGAVFIGNGWACDYGFSDRIAETAVSQASGLPLLPNAVDSAELAIKLLEFNKIEAVAPENAAPIYLRDNVTWNNKPQVGS